MHAPHTSTTDYVVLSSPHFIRLCLWCGIPWSLRNTVLGNETEWIYALALRKKLPIDPPLCLLVSLSFSLLPSITHSLTSPHTPASLRPSFLLIWDEGHYSLSSTQSSLFFQPLLHLQYHITSYLSHTVHSAHFIKEPFRMLLQPPVKWAAEVHVCSDKRKVLASSLYFWQFLRGPYLHVIR